MSKFEDYANKYRMIACGNANDETFKNEARRLAAEGKWKRAETR